MNNRRITTGAFAAMLVGLFLAGCGYPEVSETTYDLSKSLYAACNLRSEERLSSAAQMIEETSRSGQISERESRWLWAIVQQARDGDWDAAMIEARQVLKDNVQH